MNNAINNGLRKFIQEYQLQRSCIVSTYETYNILKNVSQYLNPFPTNVPLLYSLKHQKTCSFLTFSGDIETEHWLKMGSENKQKF